MTDKEAKNIFYTLDVARLVELAMEDFYKVCAACCPNSESFWLGIAGDENKHAQYIREIGEIVKTNPQEFKLKQNITMDILRCFIRDVESETRNILEGTRDVLSLPKLAEKYESLMGENSFWEILESDNVEYRELIGRIKSETLEHRQRIRGHDWTGDL